MELEDSSKPKLVEDGYCRVWGRLKAFNNKRHVGAHIIRPITDYNEIHYHFLEATAVHLFFTRGPPPTSQNGSNQPNGHGNANAQHHTAGHAAGSAQAADAHLSHISPLGRRILATLKNTPQSNEGLHVQMIASHMGVSTNEVYKGTEELVAAGVIFTTVDDHTWAVLDG
jgi:replication factor A2